MPSLTIQSLVARQRAAIAALLVWTMAAASLPVQATGGLEPYYLLTEVIPNYSNLGDEDQIDPQFGEAIAMWDDILVVGAPGTRTGFGTTFNNRGVVFVYRRDGIEWNQINRLNVGAGVSSSRCGSSVAVSSNYLGIGCPDQSIGADQGGGQRRGRVTIHHRNATDTEFGSVPALIISDAADSPDARCGTSVAILQDQDPFTPLEVLVAVGCPGRVSFDPGFPVYGGIDIYVHIFGLGWGQVASISGISATDARLGQALKFTRSGDDVLLAAGAPGASNGDGQVLVYRQGGNANTWTVESTLSGTASGRFGESLDILEDTLVVGAPMRRVPAPAPGGGIVQVPVGAWTVAGRLCPHQFCSWFVLSEFVGQWLVPSSTQQNALGHSVLVAEGLPGRRILAGEPMYPVAASNGRVHHRVDSGGGNWQLMVDEPFAQPFLPGSYTVGRALGTNGELLAVGVPGYVELDQGPRGRVLIYSVGDIIFEDGFESPIYKR